jgi:hypothetical protein
MPAGIWFGETTMTDLEHVLHQFHDSEINAGVQTFYDAGMKVWIDDKANGIQSETTINRTGSFAAPRKWSEEVTAASWLHEVALRSIAIANTPKSTPVNGENILGRAADLLRSPRCRSAALSLAGAPRWPARRSSRLSRRA